MEKFLEVNFNMDMPVIVKEKTCFFAGHRPYRFAFKRGKEKEFYNNLNVNIAKSIREIFSSGCDTFLCGGSIGFDIMCSEAVIELKKEFPEVRLGCMLPFENHHLDFPNEWQKRFSKILKDCDFIDYASPIYSVGCYHDRKRKMIENSSYLLTYFDGKGGGTARIIGSAQARRLKITNLYDAPPPPENISFFLGYDYNDKSPSSANRPKSNKR